jgi:hypothetical protein
MLSEKTHVKYAKSYWSITCEFRRGGSAESGQNSIQLSDRFSLKISTHYCGFLSNSNIILAVSLEGEHLTCNGKTDKWLWTESDDFVEQ